MKNIKVTTIVGCLTLATAVYFNVRHALNGYGVMDNKTLHSEVLAQSGTTGGGSTTGGGGGSTNLTFVGDGGSSTGGGGTTGPGSNNEGWGNPDYFKHLLGRPERCMLETYIAADGTVYMDKNNIKGGINYQTKKIDGIRTLCPYKGDGCWAMSCHQSTGSH
ncbi:MAG: hypothetical protein LBR48_05670 [Dysgonamonadaceae bacterium]|jgi:hypothetical protein|nr:hypothetical protein [Dysgonamonadaceae bacterium]